MMRYFKDATIFIVITIVLIDCSSSYKVSSTRKPNSDFSYYELNEELKGSEANIILNDEREILATGVILSDNSVVWIDKNTTKRSEIGVRQIKRIVIKDHLSGVKDGFITGFIPSFIIGFGFGSGPLVGSDDGLFYGVTFGLIGGGIGSILGFFIGHSYNYEFLSDSLSTNR